MPLAPPTGPVLIYDQERKYMETQPQTADILHAMGTDKKAFFSATRQNGKWWIGARVEDQDW